MKRLFTILVFSLAASVSAQIEQVYEAEDSERSHGAKVVTEGDWFSGKGYAGGFFRNNKATATFIVNAIEARREILTFRYNSGYRHARVFLFVNGKREILRFPAVRNRSNFKERTHIVQLKKGENRIQIKMTKTGDKAIYLDYLKVGDVNITPEKCYEVRQHLGSLFKESANLTILNDKQRKQTISFRYSAKGDAKVVIKVNGKIKKLIFTSTGNKYSNASYTIPLKKGDNSIQLALADESPNQVLIDAVTIGGVPHNRRVSTADADVKNSTQLLKKAGIDSMVLIARNFINSSHNYTYFNEGFKAGGGLYHYSKGHFKQLIDASEGEILDAELSYDAKEILFSWKKNKSTNYDLFVINLDGSNLRRLTNHPGNDFNASWLPDGGIAFLSDRDNNYAYCMHSSSAVLYRMEIASSTEHGTGETKLKRLSANYLSDIAPHVMADGKILYCRWEYVDRQQIPCQGLWAQNPDGTNLKHLFGGRMLDPVTISEAKSIPGTHKIIATLTGHNGAICGGIGIIDPSKGANNIEGITEILGTMVRMKGQGQRKYDQRYEFPSPVNEKYFLVSNGGRIEMSTYDGKEVMRILGRDQGPAAGTAGFYAALPVQPRKREPVIPSSLPANPKNTARIIM